MANNNDVVPVPAGTQLFLDRRWVPACAETTPFVSEKPKFGFVGAGEDSVVTARGSKVWLRKHSRRPHKK